MIQKIKSVVFFLVLFGLSSNILAQKLKVYEDHIDLSKVYQQGTTVHLSENNDIRVYSSSNHQTENSVAINKANPNNVIISTNGRIIYDSNRDFVTVQQPYFYTLDGGITWNGSENNPNGISSRGDPVVLFDVSGNAYYVTLGNPSGIYVLKSTNGGATWGNTVNADPLNSSGDDKEHAATDISGTYPNNIYVAWTDFNTNNIVFTRSTNSGASFGNRVILYSGLSQGAHISIGPNGEVYVAFAVYTSSGSAESGIKFTKSTNGGGTFTSANLAFPITGIGYTNNGIPEFNNTRVNSFPSMEVDRSNGSRRGWIYIVYDDKSTGDADIYLRRSTDGGTTWCSAIRVNSDQVGNGKQQWFPSIDVDEITGKIYVSYFNMDATGFLTARYVAISDDGGNTFNCGRISDVRFTPTALGPGYHDGYMGDYYETAVYNSKLYATWSDNREGNFQAYISLGVTAHQFLSNNSTEVGTMGHWENSQFVNYSVPTHFEFSPGETHSLRATYSIFSGEKYNNWNYDNSVKNFRSFNILPSTNEITAKLEPTYSGVSIKNSNEGTSNSSGTVKFKDPWYRDYADPSYGNNVRNRGTDAIWHSKSSPFYITTSSDYQGVFLGQGWPGWNPPYYSVKAGSPQTIYVQGKNRQFYFQNWDAYPSGSANFKYANNLETPVVFNNSGATVKAVMKGTGLSSNNLTYTQNNQRKIAMDNTGTLYRVYESLGKVWLEISTDEGSTWSIFNNGQPLSANEAKLPSIVGSDTQAAILIAFQEKTIGYYNYQITLKKVNSSGTIDTDIIYKESHVSYSQDAYPVVSTSGNGTTFVIWRREVSSPFYGNSGLHYWVGYSDPTGITALSTSVEIVPNTNDNSTKPSIVANKATNYYVEEAHLVWQQNSSSGSSIKYIKMKWNDNTDEVDFSNYSEASSTTGYADNFDPSIAITLNRPRVVWLTEHPVTFVKEGNLRTKGSGTSWGTLIRFSYGGGDDVESIVVNARNTSYGFVAAYAGDGNEVRYFKADRTNQAAQPLRYERYVQLSNGDDYNDMAIETFNTWSAPYYFKSTLVDATLSKTSSGNDITKGREVILSKGKSKMLFEVSGITLDDNTIDFVAVEDTLITKTKEKTIALFETKDFQLTDNSDFEFRVSYVLLSKENLSKQFGLEFQLVDSKTNKSVGILEKVETSEIEKNKVTSIGLKVNTKGIGKREVKLKLILDKELFDKISIVNTYRTGEENLPKENKKGVTFDESLSVKDYALLQNYPNPFNPSTTINYQIKEDGFVSVKIYDITGSKVTTLVNRAQTKGRYEVKFDASNLSSGVYFYRIQSVPSSGSGQGFVKTMKMILLR